jgi:hypothetical protein
MIARVVFAVAAVLAATMLPAGADTTGVTPTSTLDCTDALGGSPPPPSEIVGERVALLTTRTQPRAMQTAKLDDPVTPGYRYFAKTGLLMRHGTGTAEIIVPRSERGRVALSWGNTGHDGIAERMFRVGPCVGGSSWTAFPGGYYVTTPHCVSLIVRAGDDERRVRVGVGAPCPGQRPAPEPSDG